MNRIEMDNGRNPKEIVVHQTFEGPYKIYKSGKLNISPHVELMEVPLHPAQNVAQLVVIMNHITKTHHKNSQH